MTKYKFRVANDPGNSEHDILIDGVMYRSPNLMVRGFNPTIEHDDQDAFIQNLEKKLYCSMISKNCPASDYAVGQAAIDSGKPTINIQIGARNAKFDSEIPFISTNALIAAHAIKKAHNEANTDDEIEVIAEMVIGIPATQFTIKKGFEYSEKFMNDQPVVNVKTPKRDIKVTIKYEFVLTLSEGAEIERFLTGINPKNEPELFKKLFGECFDLYEIASLSSSDIKNATVINVSIGEGTTERVPCKNMNIDYTNIADRGSMNGLGRAIDRILEPLKKERQLSKFTRQDVSNAIQNPNSKNHEASLRFLSSELETEARTIYDLLVQDVDSMNNEVDYIIIYGGGSVLMKEHLYEDLVKLGKDIGFKVLYVHEDYSQIIEVLGFQAFLDSKEYKELKKRNLEVVK